MFSLFERYEKASGAKLNVAKSHGLLFGSWHDRVHMPIPLNWCNDAITVLGCRLSNDNQVDWNSLVERFAGQLLLWKQRQLSFRGRAMNANMLGLSIFWYQATLFEIPKTVVVRINKILFPFVWDKKREWMVRSSVTQSLAQGGLGVADVERKLLSLRAVWLRRYSSPHPWSVFFYFYVSLHFGHPVPDVLARVNIPAYLIKKLPPFYASVIRAWIALRGISDHGVWMIPRPSGDPLPVGELTARISYSLLSRSQHVEHCSLAKFRDLGIPVQWSSIWATLR